MYFLLVEIVYHIILNLLQLLVLRASADAQQFFTLLIIGAMVAGAVLVFYAAKVLAYVLHRRCEGDAVVGIDGILSEIRIDLYGVVVLGVTVYFFVVAVPYLKGLSVGGDHLVEIPFLGNDPLFRCDCAEVS